MYFNDLLMVVLLEYLTVQLLQYQSSCKASITTAYSEREVKCHLNYYILYYHSFSDHTQGGEAGNEAKHTTIWILV